MLIKYAKSWKSVQNVDKMCQMLIKCANSWKNVPKVEKGQKCRKKTQVNF